jgi:GNAT superfamily N-acetyltransferase
VLTKFRRGKQVLHEEGVISFLEHALSFFLTLLFVYSVRYVYEYKLDDSRDIRLFACPVNNIALRTASCIEEFDELLAEGLDLSWYDLGAQQCRERLSEGTILFCALVDGDCAHISWIQTRSKNHGGVYSFPIDYGREAAVGGTMTSPKYRRKGICSYVYYEIFRYLKEKDYSKAVFETHKYNILAHRFHKKLRSKVLSRVSSLTLLSRFNFTWVKRIE